MQIEQLTLLIILNEPRLNEFVSIISKLCRAPVSHSGILALYYSLGIRFKPKRGLSHSTFRMPGVQTRTHTHTP